MSQAQQYFQRFSISQRIEHWVQVFAFTLLAVTGLPQKYVGNEWAEWMIGAMGGIESVRVMHRAAAVILLVGVIYHGGYLTYKMFVERVPLSMLPSWQDAKDLFGMFAYNLGLRKSRPMMPRYNFEEKIEYWAFVWGTVVMVITGFMLWNPIATTEFMPGSFIPAAKAAHGGEALLAVLAIIVWHMYAVHIRKFNRSMFSGKLSREDMAHEHGLELAAIENNTMPPPDPEEDIARRRKIFVPVGSIIAIILLAGLYWFVTFEQTAIATIEPLPAAVEPFQPLNGDEGQPNIHLTLESYEGPESCTAAGCHDGAALASATNSEHSQRIAVAGPNPLLAHLVSADVLAGDAAAPDCLLCHAADYQPDDALVSARSVGPAGGQTCQRCHANSHTPDSLHAAAGLGCISCHPSTNHQIQSAATCTDCHDSLPHQEPILNSLHERLDCRTCHINTETSALMVDTGAAELDPATGFYQPSREAATGEALFGWQTADGENADIETENAQVVPIIQTTLLAPESFNPFEFANNGQVSDDLQETTLQIVASHGVSKEMVRTCATCHGPEADFDFEALGYDEAQADQLQANSASATD